MGRTEEDQRRREAIAQGSAQVVARPLTNFTWRVDAATFDAATLELLRSNDDIPIRRLLNEAVADAGIAVRAGDFDDLTTIISRIVAIGAQAIAYQRPQWSNEALETLARIYRFSFDAHGHQRNDGTSEDLWLVILEHVLALGALATRKHDWEAVRALAITPPGGDSEYYASWLRHAFTMAARSQRLDDAKPLVTRAAEQASARSQPSDPTSPPTVRTSSRAFASSTSWPCLPSSPPPTTRLAEAGIRTSHASTQCTANQRSSSCSPMTRCVVPFSHYPT